MIKKSIKVCIIIYSFIFARDIYVSKAALAQYETDDYLLFDTFNDSLEAPHKTHPNYHPAIDAVDLGENGPILGPYFTQEAWIYRPGKQPDPRWGLIMGYTPLTLPPGDDDDDNNPTARVLGQDANKEAPFIWKYEENGIRYGFGSGDQRNYVNVDSVLMNVQTWYHVATTFNGTDYKLYVNGEEVNNFTIGGGRVPYPTPVRYIGGARIGPGKFFGKIDEIRMWDYARTQEEIQETMNEELTGNEPGLLAYYPMDIHNQYLLDRSGNNYHGIMIGPMVKSRYFSDDCPEPDGTMLCPYPTIAGALENVQAWDRVIIRGGRYTEFIMNDGINWNNPVYNWDESLPHHQPFQPDPNPDFGGPPTNTITIEPYPNEKVIIDGTVSIDVDWEPYSHNGHSVFRAILDSAAIANEIQRPFRDVYGVWIDDRYQIPALYPNIKNPTDPSYGGPNDHVPGTFWKVDAVQADLQYYPDREDSGLGRLALLDTLEEWAFDPQNEMLYIYADERYVPTSTNVRIRVLHRMLNIQYAANLEFRNIYFFGGSIELRGINVLVEDCNFEYLHDITLPAFRDHGALCAGLFGWNVDFINCVFSHIPFVYSLKIKGMFSLVENALLTNMDWYANPGGGGPALGRVCRYMTVENSKIGGVGGSKLMEYCRIEDFIDPCDCSGINRGAHGAVKSMTRYNWVINGPGANGMRFDGGTIGAGSRRGDIHHLVTLGQNRGMRLKGDYHEVYHLTSYDHIKRGIQLVEFKYAEPGELNQGFPQDYTPGNRHSVIKNSFMGIKTFTCPTPDCWPYPESENDWDNPTDPFHLLEQGIWFSRALGMALPHNELADPWYKNLYAEDSSNIYSGGYPHPTDRTQDYDFRPRKGSSLIDAGVVIEGINDGQDLQFNWPPSFPGQNRKFIGDAPDIGAYEYGDSVYWIPGYRYPHPSFPIPRDNSVDVIPDYSVVWNYPYKKDYFSTVANVTINGPGVNCSEMFQYPNNVFFQAFQPRGIYTWSVTVDGVSGGTWSFQVDNDIYPLSDRSVDTTSHEIILSTQQTTLEVFKNNIAYIRFEVPPSIRGNWDIELNLFVEDVDQLTNGIVLYRYDRQGWSEKNDDVNIGIIDHTLGPPIDTLLSLEPDSPISLNMNNIISGPGEYSFALGVIDSNAHVSFYSNEKMFPGGYVPYPAYWPSLSFTPSIDSVDIVLSSPKDDSTIVLNGSSDDSLRFEWRFSHGMEIEIISYILKIGLPYSKDARDMDTLLIEIDAPENNARISKIDLLDMLIEANVSQGVFFWDVSGIMASGEMVAIESHSFNTVIDDPNHESIFPDEYKLYHNYPNPFNPSTIISYDLKAWSRVSLDIFDILGRSIMTLEKSIKAPGRHTTQWYGKDSKGLKMPSGVYFYRLIVQDIMSGKKAFTKTEKMMIVK
jgi:hypothetical protein